MKMIDEKGRLFGKVNMIDFLVLVFLLSFTPVFSYGKKIFLKAPQAVQSIMEEPAKKVFIDIEAPFMLVNLHPTVSSLVSIGDNEKDGIGQFIGEIISLNKSEPRVNAYDAGEGKKIFKKDPVFRQILAVLRLKVELMNNFLYYKDKQVSINYPIDFFTDEYQVNAMFTPNQEDGRTKEAERIEVIENKVDTIEKAVAKIQLTDKNKQPGKKKNDRD